ncbi:hypothetical protein [Bradyrhizobium sp. AZCC 1721]|uniref:hypothetical protein n=1 Tax=Bradyrhizobium sp. AZCC 1721 TaxID=3117016 RepID=UPI002FF3AB31
MNDFTDDASEAHDNDNAQHEREDERTPKWTFVSAKTAVQRRHGNTIDDYATVTPTAVSEETMGLDSPDAPTRVEESGRKVVRLVNDTTAKQQVKNRLAEARGTFDMSALKEPKAKPKLVPANDNVKPAEAWHLMGEIRRIKDLTERTRRMDTALYLRELMDLAETDALSVSVHRGGQSPSADYDMERSASGKVVYHHGQTLDRKKRTYSEKGGESDAMRHDGPVRTSKQSGPISVGFDVTRDDPFVQRQLDAQTELEDIEAVVGPLWDPLMDSVRNIGFTEIAKKLGYWQSVVGSFAVMRALDVAAEHIEAHRAAADFREFVKTNNKPVAARRYQRALGEKLAA